MNVVELDPEIEALEREVAAARKTARKAGRRFSVQRQKKQTAAEQALGVLVMLSRGERKGVGTICREIRGEMAAVHPEWNRKGRREFVKSYRRRGHK